MFRPYACFTHTSQSTARMRERSLVGNPTASRMMASVSTPPAGIPAAPTLDAVAVTLQEERNDMKRKKRLGWFIACCITHLYLKWLDGCTYSMVITWTKLSETLFNCAIKTAATHWKQAAPSMLTVAPIGRMKRLICLDTPLFSSTHFIIKGSVAELNTHKYTAHI